MSNRIELARNKIEIEILFNFLYLFFLSMFLSVYIVLEY